MPKASEQVRIILDAGLTEIYAGDGAATLRIPTATNADLTISGSTGHIAVRALQLPYSRMHRAEDPPAGGANSPNPPVKLPGTVDTSVCNILPRRRFSTSGPAAKRPPLPTVGPVGAAVVSAPFGEAMPDVHGLVVESVGTAPNPPPAAGAVGAAGAAAGGGAAAAGVVAVACTGSAANHATTHTENRREGERRHNSPGAHITQNIRGALNSSGATTRQPLRQPV